MYRRSLLSSLAALLASPWRVLQAVPGKDDYVKLREVVSLPAEKVSRSWSPISFNAFLEDPDDAEVDKMLKGVLLRTELELQAFCIYCPHEVCMVEFRRDTSAVKFDKPRQGSHPLFVCPCHFSVFDPLRKGLPISGPAYRGLYRFRVVENEKMVHITSVEKNVLTLYN